MKLISELLCGALGCLLVGLILSGVPPLFAAGITFGAAGFLCLLIAVVYAISLIG